MLSRKRSLRYRSKTDPACLHELDLREVEIRFLSFEVNRTRMPSYLRTKLQLNDPMLYQSSRMI